MVLHFIIKIFGSELLAQTWVPTPSLGQVNKMPFQFIQEWSGGIAGMGHCLDLPKVTGMRTHIIITEFLMRAKCMDPDANPGQ
jgi:hypothetical protein